MQALGSLCVRQSEAEVRVQTLQSQREENELSPRTTTDGTANLTFEQIDLLFQNVNTNGTLVTAWKAKIRID